MADKTNDALAGALFLVAGGIIGAGIALLLAPQSGKSTRKEINRYAKRAGRKAGETVEDFSNNISKIVDLVGERAEEILETGKDLAYEAKRDLLRAMEKGQEKLENQKSKLAKLIG